MRDSRLKTIRNKVMYVLSILLLIFVVIVVLLIILSRKPPELGIVDGKLTPCAEYPNCVCSEFETKTHFVKPLSFDGPPSVAWEKMKKVIENGGGKIETFEKNYMWVTFMTSVLRFIDDVELRMNEDTKQIQIRSASRVGYSDNGLNKKRAEGLRILFNQQMEN